jgi:hypothetical protein
MGSRDELDAALLELGPEVRKLLLVQLVLVRVRLEGLLLELSELLRLVDEGAGFQFSKLGQFYSLLLLLQRTGARLRRLTVYNAPWPPAIPYYSRTCLDFWWVRIFLLTRWSALSIVFVSQPNSSAISSYDDPSK